MKLKKMHIIGIVFGVIVMAIGATLYFINDKDINLLYFLIGIASGIIALPFVIDIVLENKRELEINSMFLEFSRNLAESVSAGTPVSKSIINMKKKSYGALTWHVEKLANQIEIGIPVGVALETFSYDVDSKVIKRAVALIREAERAGGEIDFILESVADSISEIEDLKKERKAAISNLLVQGYIIFFIFIGIMLVMQFKILPLTSGIGGLNLGSLSVSSIESANPETQETDVNYVQNVGRSFLYLLLAQGLFTGLTIGKLSEGSVKAGIKHSFILMITAFLVSSGANLFLG